MRSGGDEGWRGRRGGDGTVRPPARPPERGVRRAAAPLQEEKEGI